MIATIRGRLLYVSQLQFVVFYPLINDLNDLVRNLELGKKTREYTVGLCVRVVYQVHTAGNLKSKELNKFMKIRVDCVK